MYLKWRWEIDSKWTIGGGRYHTDTVFVNQLNKTRKPMALLDCPAHELLETY